MQNFNSPTRKEVIFLIEKQPECNILLARLKGLLHDQTKFHKLLLKSEFVKPNPSVLCLSLGREGVRFSVMVHAGTISPILGTYVTAVVIIKLKMIANSCEVITEAEMR